MSIPIQRNTAMGVEASPLEYGTASVAEDLAVSVTLFMHNPSALRSGSAEWQKLFNSEKRFGIVGNPCPKGMAFIQKHIAPQLNLKD